MKQTNMRMLALCAALCLCVATAAPAYAESTRQTPRTSFVETLLDIPVLGNIPVSYTHLTLPTNSLV